MQSKILHRGRSLDFWSIYLAFSRNFQATLLNFGRLRRRMERLTQLLSLRRDYELQNLRGSCICTPWGAFLTACIRVMRKFSTVDATVAKLFAKHIKVQDSIKFLQSTRTGIAVGTPTRLKDLMDDGKSMASRTQVEY